jgi:hypothetical protein
MIWTDDANFRLTTIFCAEDDDGKHYWVHVELKRWGRISKGFGRNCGLELIEIEQTHVSPARAKVTGDRLH